MFTKISVLVTLIVYTCFQSLFAQNLYSKAYGDRKNPPMIYIHGGPRGNSTLFEGTTAQKLADLGFYVIVYDRRGEGRSKDSSANLTFDEASHDLNNLIKQYGLKKVSLIGHSFGGIVSTLFTNQNPEKVDRLILVGALFAQQESYDYILRTGAQTATAQNDTASIRKINYINTLDKRGAEYRQLTYEIASRFGYFKMPKPTEESKNVNKEYDTGDFYKSNIRNNQAPVLFYKNESHVNIDTKPILKSLSTKGVKLFAIYGANDGIFSSKQISDLEKITGKKKLYIIENCSHYPFVDQQSQFLKIMRSIMEEKLKAPLA
ncbi:alpha/beta hydrolase [Pedobacter antarcticus 4BY]|uniref:Alpha/beta hydrolase n=3 Tax=Pedobacter antarcticus TaxID=34086 RepID=A0A081PKM9_9SPHI|nr:alpha/beta hydrolase [Pedobacter antarcticus 4BY]SFE56474.1 proline iminopeptidase [Pedobacter antarcticus]